MSSTAAPSPSSTSSTSDAPGTAPLVRHVFYADVTRDIPPVVYFHEQDPAKLRDEVGEYIVTGGYPEGDPRRRRIPSGLHEQFVKLLRAISAELGRPPGPSLPAAWISGFYGSGKSSFAKLLGLALDGAVLPDGRLLSEALLARDDSPLSPELREAWRGLRQAVDPIAVVFDIGAVSRDDEHIHSAVRRILQKRLGYCSRSHHVADYEVLLEQQGHWPAFLDCAAQTLGRPWTEALHDPLAEEDFSHCMHAFHRDRFQDPMTWFDSRAGTQTGAGSAVEETTQAIRHMLDRRAPGKTLFVVVDEVSQYVHGSDSRMLKLQTFVSDLGQKLRGRVWLFATGQQKLDDAAEGGNIPKLKDRFPEKLRVHLEPSNIRDVVHKRLLRKKPGREADLRTLFRSHRADLQLYAYGCEDITEEDFVEVYPMLPGHVDLLMRITTWLRAHSSRAKGDDYAIRGLLQLLGELFRTQRLGELPLGSLVTLDQIYEVQHTALDTDIQNTLMHLFNQPEIAADPWASRAAKAVALLQPLQDDAGRLPTTSRLVAQCLYSRLGEGNREESVRAGLEKLRALGLVAYHEKYGYKIQSSAGQDWARERDSHAITGKEISELVAAKLKALLGTADRPRMRGRPFPLVAFYSDGRQASDERLQTNPDAAVVAIDFRYLANEPDRQHSRWIKESDTDLLRNRLIWMCGRPGSLESQVRSLLRSQHMVKKYEDRARSLERDRQRLFHDEQTRYEELDRDVETVVAETFTSGELYFRARTIDKARHGMGFAVLLQGAAEEILPALYPSFLEISITPAELAQLLEPTLSGPSPKYMGEGLGILELDAGKYVATCNGKAPTDVLDLIKANDGMGGAALLAHFSAPPYGYPPDITRACLAGLLRSGKIRIRLEGALSLVTSVRDPGVKDLFSRERDLRRADLLPVTEIEISPRDRAALCRFFQDSLGVELDREVDAIADAVFAQFPGQVARLQQVEARLNRLPGFRELPEPLVKLRRSLEECKRSRQVLDTVKALKKHVDVIRDGLQHLGIVASELTDDALKAVRRAHDVRTSHLAQLEEAGHDDEVATAAQAMEQHFQSDRPWRDIASLDPHLAVVSDTYRAVRLQWIEEWDGQAQAARESVRARQGWEKLTGEQASHVLRPIEDALIDTTPDAVQPTLLVLKGTMESRLQHGREEAHARLDRVLAKVDDKVVPFEPRLDGRELKTVEDVDRLLDELRERLVAQLRPGVRLRITRGPL